MKPAPEETEKKADGKREKKHQDRRLFLYLMTLLQREGRFLDFIFEDLDGYDDAQIGAAVRSVHANCRKVINKNLVPKPVIDREEGESLTIDRGFDDGTIVLTGNVVGEPPFQGILRHKGWQAKRLDLPTLTGAGDASILMPAQVEVVKDDAS